MTKLYYIVTVILLSSFLVAGCGKSEKNRVVAAVKEYAAYLGTVKEKLTSAMNVGEKGNEKKNPEELKKLQEDSQKIIAEISSKADEISKKHGFIDAKDMMNSADKFKDDPELKALEEQFK